MEKVGRKNCKRLLILISICFAVMFILPLLVQAAEDEGETVEETVEIKSATYEIKDGYISKIKGKTTAKLFKENVETDRDILILNKKGKAVAENTIIATEMKLELEGEEIEEYTLIVRGDIDGNGSVTATDLAKLKLFTTGKTQLTEAQQKAGDLDYNGEINDIDVKKLNDLILGIDIDYEFDIENLKTYKTHDQEETEANIFYLGENIIINFHNNDTRYQPKKMKVNGKEYDVTKKEENLYEIIIDAFSETGNKSIKLEEVTLNNGQKYQIDETTMVDIIKTRPSIEHLVFAEEDESVKATFTVVADDFETLDIKLTIIDEYGNEAKTTALEIGENEVIFDKLSTVEYYDLKFTANYNDGKDEYENEIIKEEQAYVNVRSLEMKDIEKVRLYKKNDEKVEEINELNVSDLENLDDYIVKVEMKDIKAFYTTIKEYTEDDGTLKFTLDYDHIVQYDENDKKSNSLEVEFGEIVDGTVTIMDFERLNNLIKANPTGNYVINTDLDASEFISGTAIITTEFTGTIDFNGHTIKNLNIPLFNSLNGATIENLVIKNATLSGANSKGTIANIATDITIRNVHIKNLDLTSGANQTAGFIGTLTGGTIEECSLTDYKVTTAGHIRIAGIVGYMTGGTIRNCYVQGEFNSTQTADGNGMGGILGHGLNTPAITIENCISKIDYKSTLSGSAGPRLNGDIAGIPGTASVLKNNVSLSTGTGFYTIHGSSLHSSSTNNYELEGTTLTSNASGNRVKKVQQDNVTDVFFRDSANFDEDIWDLTDVSYDKLPSLKNADPNYSENKKEEVIEEVVEEAPENKEIYIPDYSRIKKSPRYNPSKEIAYSNLYKLMPFYDARYLVIDGENIAENDVLNTKIIKYVLPYDSNNHIVTYITDEDTNKISKIKVIFKDNTTTDYNVTHHLNTGHIVVYNIDDLQVPYSYNNYAITQSSEIVSTIHTYINNLNYASHLDPLTSAADSRLYRDHYNDTMRKRTLEITLQILENYDDVLTLDNEVLNQKITNDLIDNSQLKRIVYAYNYYYRWYNFEIKGAKVSDIMLFHGKLFSDSMTLKNLTTEVFSGSIGTNNTSGFYVNNLKKYTGSSTLGYFIDYFIRTVGGYTDVNDWFTEYFPTKGILAEAGLDDYPSVQYRAWYQIKRYSNYILPLITLPPNAGYIVSGPAQLLVGSQRVYEPNPADPATHKAIKAKVDAHCARVKRYFSALAGTFDVGKWNNYCIIGYDRCIVVTGYKQTTIPGIGVIPGMQTPVTETCKAGTSDPFHKNFNEALGLWQYGGSAGVGSTAGILWMLQARALNEWETWTHEYQHALNDKIMLFQAGRRVHLEELANGHMEQIEAVSTNSIQGFDVGPGYFNLTYTLNKENLVTQNLTPERINTRAKLENYYKGQQDTIDLLDYISAKAFLTLTPEQKAKIATKITQSGSNTSWGTINATQAANLTTLESLWDNKIVLRPNNAWGYTIRAGGMPSSEGNGDYGFESIWVTRWYITHNPSGLANSFAIKRNFFEMLGYGGVNAYVTYGRSSTKNDLDAIQKITLAKTGTAMNWKEYKFSRYEELESKMKDNKYIDADLMLEQFTKALQADANGNGSRNLTASTNLRKTYYHYLKRATNDFIGDPLGTDIDNDTTHITTAQELIDQINAKPYGYYVLDNDIDFTGITGTVTKTFMGELDGNGHTITGNTTSIFNKIRFGCVRNLKFDGTVIPNNITNIGILSKATQYSILENIEVTNVRINTNGRDDLTLIGGPLSIVTGTNCTVERLVNKIETAEDFLKIKEDLSGIYSITNDIDFTDYTASGNVVIPGTFNGKINGNGHTISNVTNASLFENFNGTVENLELSNFTNQATNTDNIAAFAKQTNGATLKNMRFENITLSGQHRVAVVAGMDNSNSTFENISVKNANVTGTGVYVSTFVGRKYGGVMRNIYVQGTLNIVTTENGGLVGALQEAATVENVITDVDINKPSNTYTNIANSVFNASLIGNIYNTPKVSNCIAFGNMTGYTDASETEFVPYKAVGAIESQITACLTNCYEVTEEVGYSRVTENTAGKLDTVSNTNLNEEFYRNLGFDEEIWNFSTIGESGYPELK